MLDDYPSLSFQMALAVFSPPSPTIFRKQILKDVCSLYPCTLRSDSLDPTFYYRVNIREFNLLLLQQAILYPKEIVRTLRFYKLGRFGKYLLDSKQSPNGYGENIYYGFVNDLRFRIFTDEDQAVSLEVSSFDSLRNNMKYFLNYFKKLKLKVKTVTRFSKWFLNFDKKMLVRSNIDSLPVAEKVIKEVFIEDEVEVTISDSGFVKFHQKIKDEFVDVLTHKVIYSFMISIRDSQPTNIKPLYYSGEILINKWINFLPMETGDMNQILSNVNLRDNDRLCWWLHYTMFGFLNTKNFDINIPNSIRDRFIHKIKDESPKSVKGKQFDCELFENLDDVIEEFKFLDKFREEKKLKDLKLNQDKISEFKKHDFDEQSKNLSVLHEDESYDDKEAISHRKEMDVSSAFQFDDFAFFAEMKEELGEFTVSILNDIMDVVEEEEIRDFDDQFSGFTINTETIKIPEMPVEVPYDSSVKTKVEFLQNEVTERFTTLSEFYSGSKNLDDEEFKKSVSRIFSQTNVKFEKYKPSDSEIERRIIYEHPFWKDYFNKILSRIQPTEVKRNLSSLINTNIYMENVVKLLRVCYEVHLFERSFMPLTRAELEEIRDDLKWNNSSDQEVEDFINLINRTSKRSF